MLCYAVMHMIGREPIHLVDLDMTEARREGVPPPERLKEIALRGVSTERDHQPNADALARRPAIHRALPGDGLSPSLGQIGGRLGGAGKRQASCVAPP